MTEHVKIELLIKKESLEKIKKYTEYRNIRNSIFYPEKRFNTPEDFILGSTDYCIDLIEENRTNAGYDDLGKPFRLKNRIKEIIDKKGITQARLSEMTGIDPSNISQIVRNKNQPSLDYFLRIWIALGTPPINKILYREK
jgi:DNA-binding XRE family transcriptional regulator